MTTYRISEVTGKTGLSASTLRFYENIGVLKPIERSPAGYRQYDDSSIDRARFIARTKQLGLSLDEITELADLWDEDRCAPVQLRMAQLVADKSRQIETRVDELAQLLGQLTEVRQRLSDTALDGPCDHTCGCGPMSVEPARAGGPPVMCTLAEDQIDNRLGEWQNLLLDVVTREPTARGVRLSFGTATARTIADLAAREQACCAFLEFTIRLAGSRVELEIGAPPEARPIIEQLFGRDEPAAELAQRKR